MEDAAGQGRGRGRLRTGPRPSLQGRREARLHRLAEGRACASSPASTRTPSSSWPRPSGNTRTTCWPGLLAPQGPDPDRGQLVGHLAGPGRHAQPQRLADQGRQEVLHALERGFHRRVLRRGLCTVARQGRSQAPDQARHAAEEDQGPRRPKRKLGEALADQLAREKAIMGIFDEGCMGMYNAIIQDELLNPMGVYKERLSQSALYYETTQVADDEARAVRKWMEDRGMKFVTGPNEETDLTDEQILTQCKMYIAAVRIADDFGCNTDRHPVSARAEGPAAGQRPGRGHAQQRRPPAGPQPRRQARALRGPAAAALQRSGRVRRPGRPDDLPRPQGDGPAGGKHAARRPLGRLGPLGHGERLRVGVPDQRLRAAGPFHRRLERRHQRAAAGDVLPPRRRHAQGHLQAGRNRLVADLRRRRQAEDGPGPGRRGRTARAKRPSAAGS